MKISDPNDHIGFWRSPLGKLLDRSTFISDLRLALHWELYQWYARPAKDKVAAKTYRRLLFLYYCILGVVNSYCFRRLIILDRYLYDMRLHRLCYLLNKISSRCHGDSQILADNKYKNLESHWRLPH